MLPELPRIFISKDYFINICYWFSKNYSEISLDEKKILIFLEQLIFQNSYIYFDLDIEEIFQVKDFNKINEPQTHLSDLESKEFLFHVYLQKLKLNALMIRSCKKEMIDYRIKNYKSISEHEIKPTFILANFSYEIAKEIENEFGVICLPINIKQIDKCIYEEVHAQIDQHGTLDPKKYFKLLPASNNIVIEEPYILTQSYEFICNLIESIIRVNCKNKYGHLIIITLSGVGNQENVNKLKRKYSDVLMIEHYQRREMHDRNIFTNTIWVSSQYGFMEKYSKSRTILVSRPLGVFYPLYFAQVDKCLKFLKNERMKSENYLVPTL